MPTCFSDIALQPDTTGVEHFPGSDPLALGPVRELLGRFEHRATQAPLDKTVARPEPAIPAPTVTNVVVGQQFVWHTERVQFPVDHAPSGCARGLVA